MTTTNRTASPSVPWRPTCPNSGRHNSDIQLGNMYYKYGNDNTSIFLVEYNFISLMMDSQILSNSALLAQVTTLSAVVVAFLVLLPRLSLQFKLSKLPVFDLATNNDKQRAFFLKYCTELYRKGYKQVNVSLSSTEMRTQKLVVHKICLPNGSR